MISGTIAEVAQVSRVLSCLERAEGFAMYRQLGGRWKVHCSAENKRLATFSGASIVDALAQAAQWIEMGAPREVRK